MKPIVVAALATIPKRLVKGLEDLEIRGQIETVQTTVLLRSCQNPEKIQRDMGRLAVTQTSVRKHLLKLMGKNTPMR